MSVWDNIKQIFGFGTSQFARTVGTWTGIYPTYPDYNFGAMAKLGYSMNSLIYACIEKTASTTAQVKMELVDRSNGEVLPDHPLATLLDRPNSLMTEYDFWTSVIIYLKLSGTAYYRKVRDDAGNVVSLWPLRPDWVAAKISENGSIYFEVSPWGLEPEKVPVDDMLRFRYFNPRNPLLGHSPAEVASRVLGVDNSATDYVKHFFEKGGSPPGLLTTVQKLTDSQAENIRQRWVDRYGGSMNWHYPAVLDKDAKYQQLGSTIQEMGFHWLDARNEARICSIMGVPPIIIGAKVGLDKATYSNYEQARASWWQDTLMSMYRLLADTMNEQLVRDFDPARRFKFQWDFSRVPALMEDDDKTWSRATAAFEAGAITRNEFYELVGMGTIGPLGDTYLTPFNRTPEPQPAKGFVRTLEKPSGLLPGRKQDDGDPDDPDGPQNAPNDAARRETEQNMYRDFQGFNEKYLNRLVNEIRDRDPAIGKADSPEEGKPTPDPGESGEDFISRCVPQVIEDGTTEDPQQAVAICYSIWESEREGD